MLAFLLLNLTAVSRSCSWFLGQILGQTTIFLILGYFSLTLDTEKPA